MGSTLGRHCLYCQFPPLLVMVRATDGYYTAYVNIQVAYIYKHMSTLVIISFLSTNNPINQKTKVKMVQNKDGRFLKPRSLYQHQPFSIHANKDTSYSRYVKTRVYMVTCFNCESVIQYWLGDDDDDRQVCWRGYFVDTDEYISQICSCRIHICILYIEQDYDGAVEQVFIYEYISQIYRYVFSFENTYIGLGWWWSK